MKARKLLIVDDETEILNTISFLLKKFGNDVLYASSGNEGIEKLKSHDVGLIISDFNMTDGNGEVLLNYVLKHDLNLKFYFFTSSNVDRYLRGGLISGSFSKPSDFQNVLNKAKSFLRGHPGVAPEA